MFIKTITGEIKTLAYNVFLSFTMEDYLTVCFFRAQAKNDNLPLEFRDHSVKEPFENKWKTQVEEKINHCSLTICLIGNNTYKSEAVDWELSKTLELGKGLIGVCIVESNATIPRVLVESSIKPIIWKLNLIMQEIKRVAN
jgi:hypothetical protein